jgi:hypothetical protein
MARSKTATAEAIFWQAIEAFAHRAHTTSLDRNGRPGNVTLARTNWSTWRYDGFSATPCIVIDCAALLDAWCAMPIVVLRVCPC